MYGDIAVARKFFLSFNKIFHPVQATCKFSLEKFGEVPIFAPGSRIKLGATLLTDSGKKQIFNLSLKSYAVTPPYYHRAILHLSFQSGLSATSHGNCYSSSPNCIARVSCAG